MLLTDLLTRHLGPAPARLEGRGSLELTVQRQPATGRVLVHVINYGGQRNNLYEDPAAVHGLRLGVRGVAGPGTALVAGAEHRRRSPPPPTPRATSGTRCRRSRPSRRSAFSAAQ